MLQLFFALLLVVSLPLAHAAPADSPPELALTTASLPRAFTAPSLTSSPEELLALRDAIDEPHEYIDVLLDHVRVDTDERGHLRETLRIVWVPRHQGVLDSWGKVEVTWQPWHQDRPVVRSRVITPDGEQHLLQADSLTVSTDDKAETTTYTTDQTLRGPLPNLRLDSVVETEIVITSSGPPDWRGWGHSYTLHSSYSSVAYQWVQADLPDDIPLTWHASVPDVPVQVRSKRGRTTLDLRLADRPAIPAPTFAPPWFKHPALITLSGRATWPQIAAAYGERIQDRLNPEAARGLVAGLSASGSVSERATHITRTVQDRVRYIGLQFDEAAIIPYPTQEVLDRGYGDCKDQASVLVSALRAADIPAHLALVRTRQSGDIFQEAPRLNAFDHAIVYVPGEPELWIDPTARDTPATMPPTHLYGRRALVIGVDDPLRTIRVPSASESTFTDRRVITLRHDVAGSYTEEHLASGWITHRLNAQVGAMGEERLSEMLVGYIGEHHTNVDGTTPKVEVQREAPPSRPARSIHVASSPALSTNQGDVAVPAFGPALLTWLPDGLLQADPSEIEQRTVPYWIEPHISTLEMLIQVPSRYEPGEIFLTEPLDFGPIRFTADSSWDPQAQEFKVSWTFEVQQAQIDAEHMAAFVRSAQDGDFDLQTPVFHDRVTTLLAAKRFIEAAQVAQSAIRSEPGEPSHHKAFARLLLDIGMAEVSGHHLEAAVETFPESGTLWFELGFNRMYSRDGRYLKDFDADAAISAFDRSIQVAPKLGGAARNKALVELERAGRDPQAVARAAASFIAWRDTTDDAGFDADFAQTLLTAGHHDKIHEWFEGVTTQPIRQVYLASQIVERGLEGARKAERRAGRPVNQEREAWAGASIALVQADHLELAAELIRWVDPASHASNPLLMAIAAARSEPLWPPASADEEIVDVVQRHLAYEIGIEGLDARDVLTKRAAKTWVREWNDQMDKAAAVPDAVVMALVRNALTVHPQGSDEHEWLVTVHNGNNRHRLIVVKERRGYRIDAAPATPNVHHLGQRALSHVDAGRIDHAVELLKWSAEDTVDNKISDIINAAELGPNSPSERVRLTALAVHAAANRTVDGPLLSPLRDALRDPEPTDALLLGHTLSAMDSFEVPLDELKRVFALASAAEPRSENWIMMRFIAHLLYDDPDGAIATFHTFTQDHPSIDKAFALVIYTLVGMAEYSNALPLCVQASEQLGPQHGSNSLCMLAELMVTGPTDDLRAQARAALERAPTPAVRAALATTMGLSGNLDTAIYQLIQATVADPNVKMSGAWGVVRGLVAEELGMVDHARSVYQGLVDARTVDFSHGIAAARLEALDAVDAN